jgi:DNA-binding transcriptional LysR family regulator
VVADCKSVSKAAQMLRVTPGMVSRRLDDLEAALDVRLFTRTSAGMVLTPAGADMLDRALSMRRFAEAIEDSVRERDRKDEGMVTVRTPDGLGGHWIAPRLGAFLERNPKIQITLDCGTLTADMGADPDLLVAVDKADARIGDVVTPLATLHYVFVAAPSYLERHGVPRSLAAMVGEHRGLRHIGQVHQRETWGSEATALETLASISLHTNSSTAIIGAVLGGAGICTAPTMLCHLEPSLRVISEDFSVPIQLWLVTRREARLSARVERVAEWLHASFDTKLFPWFRSEFIPPSRFEAELAAASDRLAPAEQPEARPRQRSANAMRPK